MFLLCFSLASAKVSINAGLESESTSERTSLRVREGFRGSKRNGSRSATALSISDSAYVSLSFSPGSGYAFDLQGNNGTIQTSGGYVVVLQRGSSQVRMSNAEPVSLSGVVLWLTPVSVSANAILLCFTLQNTNSYSSEADIAVDCDIVFNGYDVSGVTVWNLGLPRGFNVTAGSRTITYICGNYSLVTDCSTYWFGQYGSRGTNRWSQVTSETYTADSGMAFSWQSVEIPGLSSVQRRMLVKFGSFSNTVVTLTIEFPSVSEDVEYGDLFWVTFTVNSEILDDSFSLFIVVDGDSVGTSPVLSDLQSGATATSFCPSTFVTTAGPHTLWFYAVNLYGDISNCISWSFVHGPIPTPFPTFTIPVTMTRPVTRSAPRSPTASPTPVPAISFSLAQTTFNINGVLGSYSIGTSYSGYTARLSVGSSLAVLYYGTVTIGAMTAGLNCHRLSSNALFLFVKITNSGSSSQNVSFSISADVNFDGSDSAPMATLPSNRGFRIYSSQNEIRFICRSYPLVRDVSSFWIGSLGLLSSNYWTQVGSGTVSGVDAAAAFAWQSISVPARSFVTRGVIVKFGGDESSVPTLNFTFPTISSPFFPNNSVHVAGTITNSRYADGIRLLYVIDNDLSTLQDANLSLPGNSPVSFSFVPERFGIDDINHQIAFYGVSSYGDVSLPQTLMLNGVPAGEEGGDVSLSQILMSAPSISVSHLNDTASIVGPIGAVTGVGLLVLIVATLCIRSKRNTIAREERSALGMSIP
jgi:hypothetical protein